MLQLGSETLLSHAFHSSLLSDHSPSIASSDLGNPEILSSFLTAESATGFPLSTALAPSFSGWRALWSTKRVAVVCNDRDGRLIRDELLGALMRPSPGALRGRATAMPEKDEEMDAALGRAFLMSWAEQ